MANAVSRFSGVGSYAAKSVPKRSLTVSMTDPKSSVTSSKSPTTKASRAGQAER
jgi:hypothetical protein